MHGYIILHGGDLNENDILFLRNRVALSPGITRSATSGFGSVSRDRICVNFKFENKLYMVTQVCMGAILTKLKQFKKKIMY